MINICIVEDESDQADLLRKYIQTYGNKTNQQFAITHFTDGIDLVDEYRAQFDIILLDIQMKHLDGMVAAEKIRKVDADVVIIFITSTVRYAVQGYAVDALGYVLKPVPYLQFEQLFDKAISRVMTKKQKLYIRVSVDERQLKLDCDNIYYIESQRNNVCIHCADEDYITAGPLKKFEEMGVLDGSNVVYSIRQIKNACKEVLSTYPEVTCAYLFGSYARGEATSDSDIDIVVVCPAIGMRLFGISALLEERLHKTIDLHTHRQLLGNEILMAEVLKEGVKIYG